MDKNTASIQAVLDYGKEASNITSEEANTALSTFQSFLSSHPDYTFFSPRERYITGKRGAPKEAEMWSSVQPILDKTQGVEWLSNTNRCNVFGHIKNTCCEVEDE